MNKNNLNLLKLSSVRKILKKRGQNNKEPMAWRTHAKSNEEFIDSLREQEAIESDEVSEVMKATDRKFYCRAVKPYVDRPHSIGHGATISAPHMHAHALDLLIKKLDPSSKVLDVGSGSGYLTACFFRAMSLGSSTSTGMVVGIEHHPKLVEDSIENLNNDDPQMIESGKLKIIQGDGRLGCPEYAPYDAIHVGAASDETPYKLLEQLKNGGRMICPVGPEGEAQELIQYDKDAEGEITKKVLVDVVFVPLTDLDAYED